MCACTSRRFAQSSGIIAQKEVDTCSVFNPSGCVLIHLSQTSYVTALASVHGQRQRLMLQHLPTLEMRMHVMMKVLVSQRTEVLYMQLNNTVPLECVIYV